MLLDRDGDISWVADGGERMFVRRRRGAGPGVTSGPSPFHTSTVMLLEGHPWVNCTLGSAIGGEVVVRPQGLVVEQPKSLR